MNFKKLALTFFTFALIALVPLKLFSDDLEKANKYYSKYKFYYAIEIYENLIGYEPTLEIAQKLANSYRFIHDSKSAETAYERVLTYPESEPINYFYYAEALKENGKFEEAKANYSIYADKVPSENMAMRKKIMSSDSAKIWLSNPDQSIEITNEQGFNTQYSEFSPIPYKGGFIFTSDREFLKYTRNPNNRSRKIAGWTGNPYLKLYQAVYEDTASVFTGDLKLKKMSKDINTRFHTGPAALSKDGRTLFFTKTGTSPNFKYWHFLYSNSRYKDSVMRKTIYISQRQGDYWSNEKAFPYNNAYKYSVQHPALSPDGKILYFASDMEGTLGGMDIFYCQFEGSSWSSPVNCGPEVNTANDEVFPYLREDGKLFFSSNGHFTIGGLDIFSAVGEKDNWKNLENLKAPFNSAQDDFGVFFFKDLQTGYLSSNRLGGEGADDIYMFSKKPVANTYFVKGKVARKETGEPLKDVAITLYNKHTKKEISTITDSIGNFTFELNENTDYTLKGNPKEYIGKIQQDITTKGATNSTVYNVKYDVEKGENSYIVKLNIYYDLDKADIRRDAEKELNKLLIFMKNTPNVRIEMRAHTDSRGDDQHNLELSERRAEAAKNYLIAHGADSSRLSAKGFGETELLNKCAEGIECTDEEHQLNRRTEFKIVQIKK